MKVVRTTLKTSTTFYPKRNPEIRELIEDQDIFRFCRRSGGLLYALSCTSMLAIAFSGLLSIFGITAYVNFFGPLGEPVVVLPILIISIVFAIFGMLRRAPLQIALVTAGGALSYAGMSSMSSMQAINGMSSEAVYIAWAGIALVASSFLFDKMRPIKPTAKIQTTPQASGISSEEKPVAAFILSLAAGVFILLGSLAANAFGMSGPMMSHMMGMQGMMQMPSDMNRMMDQMPHMPAAFHTLFFSLGVLSGSLVFVGALMLYLRPEEHATWGAIILTFAIVSIVTPTAGFIVGLILGIIGGTFALTWKPTLKL